MAVEKETQLEAWLEENMPESGGNPNYIETIEGTLENPWGNYNYSELITDINNHEISCELTVRPGDHAIGHLFYYGTALSGWGFVYGTANTINNLYRVMYKADGTLNKARIFTSFNEYTEIDPATPCTLTVIHHPMP